MKAITGLCLLLAILLFVFPARAQNSSVPSSLKLTSPAFSEGGKIPKKYTCDSTDLSPPLHINAVPTSAKSLALIVDDPDAPGRTWNHWLLWNIDPKTKEVRENSVPKDAAQGTTDFGSAKYGGPCPPSGVHHYFFRLYALDTTLSLAGSTTRTALDKAMVGHVIMKGTLMGTYARER